MDVFILAGVIMMFLLAGLAIFARGGAKEPATTMPSRPHPRDRDELDMLARELIDRWGMRIERSDPDEDRGFGLLAVDPQPIIGNRVYLRVFVLPQGERANETDVQSSLDAARDEAVHKVILISPYGFSDEAILASKDTLAELVDGEELERLIAAPRSTAPAWRRAPQPI